MKQIFQLVFSIAVACCGVWAAAPSPNTPLMPLPRGANATPKLEASFGTFTTQSQWTKDCYAEEINGTLSIADGSYHSTGAVMIDFPRMNNWRIEGRIGDISENSETVPKGFAVLIARQSQNLVSYTTDCQNYGLSTQSTDGFGLRYFGNSSTTFGAINMANTPEPFTWNGFTVDGSPGERQLIDGCQDSSQAFGQALSDLIFIIQVFDSKMNVRIFDLYKYSVV